MSELAKLTEAKEKAPSVCKHCQFGEVNSNRKESCYCTCFEAPWTDYVCEVRDCYKLNPKGKCEFYKKKG
ncbi:hypothetical protein LCGC14_1998050 [marine sediment metagenome]|uniref:Uncharacterized protein n=1 Tax=marine sediment metagenome TaxID=412755 RepID=A0A0F9FRV7_9ZZZZ